MGCEGGLREMLQYMLVVCQFVSVPSQELGNQRAYWRISEMTRARYKPHSSPEASKLATRQYRHISH